MVWDSHKEAHIKKTGLINHITWSAHRGDVRTPICLIFCVISYCLCPLASIPCAHLSWHCLSESFSDLRLQLLRLSPVNSVGKFESVFGPESRIQQLEGTPFHCITKRTAATKLFSHYINSSNFLRLWRSAWGKWVSAQFLWQMWGLVDKFGACCQVDFFCNLSKPWLLYLVCRIDHLLWVGNLILLNKGFELWD